MKETVSFNVVYGVPLFQTLHDAGDKKIVIFCHGFRGTSVGPSRSFVDIARRLEQNGISSLRFDQHCSGNSAGNFVDSSFVDWVETTKELARTYLLRGYQVALFGQSMGGATIIDVASQISGISAAVAWVPDPNVDEGERHQDEILEEGGQLIKGNYWLEARDAHIYDKLNSATCPMYIVQCSDDEYVNDINHRAIENNAQPQHQVEMFENYKHSAWSHEQFETIIDKSLVFLLGQFHA